MAEISIITPVLNQVDHLEKCILSVARQGVDVEHIIIDGGSTDGTLDLILKHEDKLLFWISEPDNGQSDAVNKGLEHATGKYFNWLNADDHLLENALSTIIDLGNDDADVIVGRCRHVDNKGNDLSIGSARIWDSVEATLGNYSMGQPSVFYRTSVVKDLGALNTVLHYCMDMDLWFRYLLEYGQESIVMTDRILSHFLVHPGSKSVDREKEMEAEKYGLYHALLRPSGLPEVVAEFFRRYPIPKGMVHQTDLDLNYQRILSHFCWHLMHKAYEDSDTILCRKYFEVVKAGQVLSSADTIKWRTRLKAMRLLNR